MIRSFLQKNWFGLISVTASAGVLAYSIFFRAEARETLTAVRGISLRWLCAAIACMVLYWILDGLVLYMYTKTKYKRYSIVKSMKTSMIGLLYNALTPFAMGGQPMQILDMSKNGISAGDAGSFIAVKSVLYQICLTVYALFAVLTTFRFFIRSVNHFAAFVLIGFLFNLLFIGAVFLVCVNRKLAVAIAENIIRFLAKIKILSNPEMHMEKVLEQVTLFHSRTILLNKARNIQLQAFLYTVIQLSCFYIIPYCIYRSFHLSDAAILYIVAAGAIVSMITAFFPLPGASGAAEGGFYLFFAMFFPRIMVLPAIFLWRFVTYYSCILAGGLVSALDILL